MAAPKGHPRWGGRRKGVPNKINAATRERIESEADPIGFLMRIVRGEEIDGQVPTLDQRINAARLLSGKVQPDLRSVDMEIGDKRQRQVEEMSDEELDEILAEAS